MLRLASSLAEGIIFSRGCSKGYLRDSVSQVRRHSEKQIALVAVVDCCVQGDNRVAKTRLARRVLPMLLRPSRGELMCTKAGLDPRLPLRLGAMSEEEAVDELLADNKILEFGVAGDPSTCKAEIQEFLSTGVDGLALVSKDHQEILQASPRLL